MRGGLWSKRCSRVGRPDHNTETRPQHDWRLPDGAKLCGNGRQRYAWVRRTLDGVKTRQPPFSTVQMQHRTISACHLGNIAMRLKRKITWDPAKQEIVGDKEANEWQSREQRPPYQILG